MDLRRAADVILRSQSSPLAAFLMPSMPTRWQSLGARSSRSILNRPTYRGLSTTPRRSADSSEGASPKDARPEANSANKADTSKPKNTWSGTPRSYSGMFDSPDYKPSNQNPVQNSATELIEAFKKDQQTSRSRGFDVSRMAQPPRKAGSSDIMASLNQELAAYAEAKIPIRLKPSAGRTVNVGPNMDVGRAFQVLQQNVSRNKLKNTMMRQKFHERPGLKRKRLKSIRWRRRFLQGFKDAVQKVKDLKKQGW